jgi:single-strand DNA-binding protein
MKSLNKVQIIGNLTRDPELRTTPNGQPVATIGVATNRAWNDASGEKREEVEYHDVVVWGKLAEICQQILAKGRKVYFEGRLQTRSWEAPDGGGKRYKTEIVAQRRIPLQVKMKLI